MSVTIDPERPDTAAARVLIDELAAHLSPQYPDESQHGYSVEKLIEHGVVFFVARHSGEPAGCGGVQIHPGEYAELKRMYVRPAFRGLGIAKRVLDRLCEVARDSGVPVLRLETGIHQKDAIALYERAGFTPIGPFGDYTDDPLSRYFEKAVP